MNEAAAWEVTTRGSGETRQLGSRLGRELRGGEVILLVGDLGTGKTTFTQGIAKGLDVAEYAKSPSFVLVNEYRGRLPLYHADLFRIQGGLEAWYLGMDDYLASEGVTVIEWADRALSVFPADHLRVELTRLSEFERRLRFIPSEGSHVDLVDRLAVLWGEAVGEQHPHGDKPPPTER